MITLTQRTMHGRRVFEFIYKVKLFVIIWTLLQDIIVTYGCELAGPDEIPATPYLLRQQLAEHREVNNVAKSAYAGERQAAWRSDRAIGQIGGANLDRYHQHPEDRHLKWIEMSVGWPRSSFLKTGTAG